MCSFKIAAIKVLRKSKEPLHYDEITKRAIEQDLIVTSGATPDATMNSRITSDIKHEKDKSAFIRIKPGIFQLNPKYSKEEQKQKEKQEIIEIEEKEIETKHSRFIGKAGEHLVVSKLLFQEFNANVMSVDEGIDIVATRKDRLYNIQVKTANEKYEKYVDDINISSYQKHNSSNTFYIFVLRGKEENFLILPYVEVQKNIDQKNIRVIDHGKRYRVNFTLRDGNIYLGNLKNDATYFKNNWGLII